MVFIKQNIKLMYTNNNFWDLIPLILFLLFELYKPTDDLGMILKYISTNYTVNKKYFLYIYRPF